MTRNAIVSLAVLFALGVGLFIVKSRVDATKKAQASGEEAQTVPAPEPTSQAPIPSIPVAVSGPAGIGGATGDINGDGYLNLTDYDWFEICFSYSGPGVTPLPSGCLEVFDLDTDGDVDLADFALFQQTAGHLPIPMRDHLGAVLAVGSTEPYSPRQTCGPVGCHDADHISNGEWFQQGRANVAGNVDMADDYFQDGRHWIKSPGRYGKWGQSFQYMLAAKDNTHPSQIDQTTFAWVKECSKCHAGGGPGEYDRDDKLAYNRVTGEFGYELLGKTPGDVALDGDYSIQDRSTGTVTPGAWDVTDLSGPDCLLCHRADRPTVGGVDQTHGYRGNTLAAGTVLENSLGDPVPAYARLVLEYDGGQHGVHRSA